MYQRMRVTAGLCIIGCCMSFAIAQIISNGNSLKFKLSAMNLPAGDIYGSSDPYVRIYTASGFDRHPHWTTFGETKVISSSKNPIWNEIFAFPYTNGTNQKWHFFVKDHDLFWNIDDHLGRVELDVDTYVKELMKDNGARINQPVQLSLTHPPGGVLVITPVYDS